MQNLKVKALALLAGWMGAVFAGIAVVQLAANYFGSETVLNIFVGAVLAWLMYQVYNLILAKLEWDARVDELNKK